MMRGIVPSNERSGTTGAPTRRGLLDGNRIGRRKGVLESFVERLFLAPTLIAIAIVLMRFAFGIGNHFGFSDDANFCALINERYPFRVIRLPYTYSWRHVHPRALGGDGVRDGTGRWAPTCFSSPRAPSTIRNSGRWRPPTL